ncbi:hypothetical protein COLO4_04805 [Corchorus olitorius]|uniref:Uncharacterized protein n=1 Tax=Corchorus olitorius TaxID=93759 RepID=A0A1R3KSV8_9ROSI|nr:hypothetical protein COLO4_04805 [Corchorus olitorius]
MGGSLVVTILQPTAAWIENKVGPFELGHNLILAHAAAARIYKNKYQIEEAREKGIELEFQPDAKVVCLY